MKFLSLTVENFGVFRGEHHFEFAAPQVINTQTVSAQAVESHNPNEERSVSLVRGHNGAGKSTLFSAFALALHGSLAAGPRLTRVEYNDFLLSRFHRRNSDGQLCERAQLRLRFEYVDSGRPMIVDAERCWTRNGSVVTEELQVRRDGARPDEVAPGDEQTWLSDLLSPGVSPVCFFDAERLDALSSAQHEAHLSEIIRRLLGLDIVERLGSDLELYMLRNGGKESEPLRLQVFDGQRALAQFDGQLETLKATLQELSNEAARLKDQQEQQEQRLASEGGSYAERRPLMQARRAEVAHEIEELQAELREACSDLLPFALAPSLCAKLERSLEAEAATVGAAQLGQLWERNIAQAREKLQHVDFWEGLHLSSDERSDVVGRFAALLHDLNPQTPAATPLHPMMESERAKVRDWITKAMGEASNLAVERGTYLRELSEEARAIDTELRRAPEEDALASVHVAIERLSAELGEIERKIADKTAQLHGLQYARDEAFRKYTRAVEEFTQAQKARQKMALADRSRVALRAYSDALTRQKLGELESLIVEKFNRLCQKDQLLRGVSIHPETFAVSVQNAQGRALGWLDFSAGERQLYTLALLWALREVSGRVLPLLIDTPLGRLDESHRERLVSDFFPRVSRQVLLFTTDAEMDESLLRRAQSSIARDFRLRINAVGEETEVQPYDTSRRRPSTGAFSRRARRTRRERGAFGRSRQRHHPAARSQRAHRRCVGARRLELDAFRARR